MAITDELIEQLQRSLSNPPGIEAHQRMSLRGFRQEPQSVLEQARKSAVMMVLYPREQKIYSVLIQRPAYDGVHSRQIALPGGQHDPEDESFEATALRETWEEIGVNGVQVIGRLTELYIKPSDFLVYPFVGYLKQTPSFTLQQDEVDEIVEFPIFDLLNDQLIEMAHVETKLYGTLKVPSFNINGKTVWGATAAMLNEFKEILKSIDSGR